MWIESTADVKMPDAGPRCKMHDCLWWPRQNSLLDISQTFCYYLCVVVRQKRSIFSLVVSSYCVKALNCSVEIPPWEKYNFLLFTNVTYYRPPCPPYCFEISTARLQWYSNIPSEYLVLETSCFTFATTTQWGFSMMTVLLGIDDNSFMWNRHTIMR